MFKVDSSKWARVRADTTEFNRKNLSLCIVFDRGIFSTQVWGLGRRPISSFPFPFPSSDLVVVYYWSYKGRDLGWPPEVSNIWLSLTPRIRVSHWWAKGSSKPFHTLRSPYLFQSFHFVCCQSRYFNIYIASSYLYIYLMAKPWISLKMIEGAFSMGAGGIFLTKGKRFGNRTKRIGRSFFPSLPSTLVSLEGLATPCISWARRVCQPLAVRVTGRNDREIMPSLFRC